jgi:hypothetical protein
MTSELSLFSARLRFETKQIPDAEFNALAIELFALQFHYNRPYQNFCKARDIVPTEISHWSRIPAIPTSAFKEMDFSCLPLDERTKVFHSSGTTTQKPSKHFHNAESLAVYETSLWRWFATHLLSDVHPKFSDLDLLILTPAPALAPKSSLVHMFETIRQKFGSSDAAFLGCVTDDGVWDLDFDAARARLGSNSQNPKIILGTAFSFVHLLDRFAQENFRVTLPIGSRAMETGGYKGRSRTLPKTELHRMITARLGIPETHIVCEYGMSELSSQAYDSEIQNSRFTTLDTRRAFHFPPWARAQIISPETGCEVSEGETGSIRIFDLANVYSVMAIQTEDLGIHRGDAFELIGRAEFVEQRGCSLMAT